MTNVFPLSEFLSSTEGVTLLPFDMEGVMILTPMSSILSMVSCISQSSNEFLFLVEKTFLDCGKSNGFKGDIVSQAFPGWSCHS